MTKTHIRDFTHGNITKQIVVFASPLFFSNLLQVVYNMIDMIIVGQTLGKAGTSAVAIGGDIVNFITFLVMGFSNAGQVLIAKYIGSKQYDKLGRFVGTMSGFMMACAIVIGALGLIFQNQILRLMNTPQEAFAGAVSYSAICLSGLVFIYGYNIVSAILRGMGDSKHPFVFIAIAAVLNVVLDVLFVIVIDMGAGGAALATVISQGVSFIACVIFLFKNQDKFSMTLTPGIFIHWDKGMLSNLIKLGVPIAIKSASVQVSRLFVNSWINSYGVIISAFSGIAHKIASTANLISGALNAAGSTMVGQNVAAGEFNRVTKILLRLAAITLSVSVLISAAIALFPDAIFGIFTSDEAVLAIGDKYIPIAMILFLSSALRAPMNALINGSGHYRVNFVTAIFDGIIMRIGLALLFGLALHMEHIGFWLGDALAGFVPFVVGFVFYLTGAWKKCKET